MMHCSKAELTQVLKGVILSPGRMHPFIMAFPSWSHNPIMASIRFISADWSGQGSICSMENSGAMSMCGYRLYEESASSQMAQQRVGERMPLRMTISMRWFCPKMAIWKFLGGCRPLPRTPMDTVILKFDLLFPFLYGRAFTNQWHIVRYYFCTLQEKINVFTHASLYYPDRVKENYLSF